MNAIIRRLQKWNLVPVDVITNSFYQLCAYYHREIQRSIHQCGSWIVRDEYQHFQREPSLLPRMDIVPDPKDIVDIICNGRQRDVSSNIDSKLKANHSPNDSHISMAHCAIANNRVKLAEDGAWVVIGTDCVSHSTVRLFPKESCSCHSTTTCYHIRYTGLRSLRFLELISKHSGRCIPTFNSSLHLLCFIRLTKFDALLCN